MPRTRETSGGIIFVNKTTGWVVASFLIFLVFGIAYVGATLLTRGFQFGHFREEQKKLGADFEELKIKTQRLERHIVELSTQMENLEESHD